MTPPFAPHYSLFKWRSPSPASSLPCFLSLSTSTVKEPSTYFWRSFSDAVGSSSGPCLSGNTADLLNQVWPSVWSPSQTPFFTQSMGPAPGAVYCSLRFIGHANDKSTTERCSQSPKPLIRQACTMFNTAKAHACADTTSLVFLCIMCS